MPLFRLVAALLIFGVAGCVGAWLFTDQRKYLSWAIFIIKMMVVLGLAFFGVLLLERVATMV